MSGSHQSIHDRDQDPDYRERLTIISGNFKGAFCAHSAPETFRCQFIRYLDLRLEHRFQKQSIGHFFKRPKTAAASVIAFPRIYQCFRSLESGRESPHASRIVCSASFFLPEASNTMAWINK